jgi:hypothetical protein
VTELRTDVSVLYVDPRGPYPKLVADWWDEKRDARNYAGPNPVVAHPPCQRWGRYWSGGPSAKQKRLLGDDNGCFAAALSSVRTWGGVLEHPEASHAFAVHGLARPKWRGGWLLSRAEEWVCCVAQGNYGHRARKLTWLCYVGASQPPELDWSIPTGMARLDNGNDPVRPVQKTHTGRLKTTENIVTPEAFASLLLELAAHARR